LFEDYSERYFIFCFNAEMYSCDDISFVIPQPVFSKTVSEKDC